MAFASPTTSPHAGADHAKIKEAIQKGMGGINPKLADLTVDVLYADVWERPELSKRDRSLVTVAALIAMNRPDELRIHLDIALQNGLTRDELTEAITHLAFYSGWPSAVTATMIAKDVLFDEKVGVNVIQAPDPSRSK